eukprot:463788_1
MQFVESYEWIRSMGCVNESLNNVSKTISGLWISPRVGESFTEVYEELLIMNEKSASRNRSWNITVLRQTCLAIMDQLLCECVLPLTAIQDIMRIYSTTHDLVDLADEKLKNRRIKDCYLAKIPCVVFNLPQETGLLQKNVYRSYVCLTSFPMDHSMYLSGVIDFIASHVMRGSIAKHVYADVAFNEIKEQLNFNYVLNNNVACFAIKSILEVLTSSTAINDELQVMRNSNAMNVKHNRAFDELARIQNNNYEVICSQKIQKQIECSVKQWNRLRAKSTQAANDTNLLVHDMRIANAEHKIKSLLFRYWTNKCTLQRAKTKRRMDKNRLFCKLNKRNAGCFVICAIV